MKIFEDPSRRYYIRELAREIKISPSNTIKIIDELKKERIIRKEKKRHSVEITANTDNILFIHTKRMFNLVKIYESEIIEHLVKEYNPKAIILFGSYSRGEDVKRSDIDIAIITDEKKIIGLENFEKRLGRKIHLLPMKYKEITDELYSNLINGIVLYGYMDAK